MSTAKTSESYRDGLHIPPGGHAGIFVACLIAETYRDEIPTAKQLMARFGMSRACANRWRNPLIEIRAMRAAREGGRAPCNARSVTSNVTSHPASPRAVLADAMRLAPEERAQVSRWLALCVRVGLDLDPDSLAGADPAELSKLFGGAP